MSSGAPTEMTTKQDRIDWAKPDAQARMDFGREWFMPGSELVPYKDPNTGETRYRYEGGEMRTYDSAGGAKMESTEFTDPERRGQGGALGLANQRNPYTGEARDFTSETFASSPHASQAEIDTIAGRTQQLGTEEMDRILRGDYLDPNSNRWLGQTFDMAASDIVENYKTAIAPEIQGGMIGAGKAYGSQAQQAALRGQDQLQRNLGRLATDIYGSAYETERDRQAGAAADTLGRRDQMAGNVFNRNVQFAPQMADLRAAEYGDYDVMREIGGDQRDLRDENARRRFVNQDRAFSYNEEVPFRMAAYQDTADRGTGTGTGPSPYQSDPWGTAIGAVGSGASLANALG
jgi:hypothetical protein